MLYAIAGIALLALLTFMQMLLPRQSLFALLALVAGAAGLTCAFRDSLTVGLVAVAATILVVPLSVYLSLLIMAPYEPKLATEPQAQIDPVELAKLTGLSGMTVTPIEKAGVALIGGKRIQVFAQTAPIAVQTPVVVTAVEGSRVVVRSA